MAALAHIVGRINRFAEYTAVIAFAGLILDVTVAVFFRYVLNDSLVWAEELARYCFVWVTFLGGGLGVGKNIHVGVDSLVMLLPARQRQLVEIGVEAAIIVFLLILIAVGVQFTLLGLRSHSMLLGISMSFVYAALPAGALVMLANVMASFGAHYVKLVDREVQR